MCIYNRQLVFYINKKFNTKSYDNYVINAWNHLKDQCELGEQSNKHYVQDWLDKCGVEGNKNLVVLERVEGGVCDASDPDRQIRFRNYKSNIYQSWCSDDDIVMDIFDGETGKWSLEELEDLKDAFVRFAIEFIGTDCVTGIVSS